MAAKTTNEAMVAGLVPVLRSAGWENAPRSMEYTVASLEITLIDASIEGQFSLIVSRVIASGSRSRAVWVVDGFSALYDTGFELDYDDCRQANWNPATLAQMVDDLMREEYA